MEREKVNVFFIEALETGGIENYLLRFLEYSKGLFKPVVVCKSGKLGPLVQAYEAIENVDIVPMKFRLYNFLDWIKIFQLLRSYHTNAVCDFSGNFAGPILLMSKLAGVSVRISFYRGSSNRFKETLLRLLVNDILKVMVRLSATKVLSNSKAAFDFFFPGSWKNNCKYKVIYNGVILKDINRTEQTLRQELGLGQEVFVVGNVGRYNVAKNHSTIIRVAEIVCRVAPNIIFLICGRGTKDFVSENVIGGSFLSNRIIALENRRDVERVYASMDLFLFPSVTEGQPNALIEAMISGVPVVASNIPSIVETVPAEMRENLFDPFDANGYANKILDLMKQEKKSNYADWARKKFDYNRQFNEFYQELK